MKKRKDFPLDECARAVDALLKADPNADVYQKWTCAKCGERVTANTPNVFTEEGHHENCGHVTDLRKTGCNYMVIAGAPALKELIRRATPPWRR